MYNLTINMNWEVKILNGNNTRAYNFNAGPSALPLEVLQKAQRELVNFKGTGMSVMELSHRSSTFDEVHNQAIQLLRNLYGISDDYDVLFLQGGASTQFSMVPMNFLQKNKRAAYLMTGSWSEKALKEARLFGDAYEAATSKDQKFNHIPAFSADQLSGDEAYLHLTSNNTIYGTQLHEFPDTGNIPLIADMSSDIMSRPIDVNKFDLIYAGAQKNLGPSGVTVVIIKKELLKSANTNIPTMFRYQTHADKNSLYNTPPTFAIYMLGEVLKWIDAQGGVETIAENNQMKANFIYHVLDNSDDFYTGHAEKASRSNMNITFRLKSEELEMRFLEEAKAAGFVGLNGHRSVGGCRASIYNAVPAETCKALSEFMTAFKKKNS